MAQENTLDQAFGYIRAFTGKPRTPPTVLRKSLMPRGGEDGQQNEEISTLMSPIDELGERKEQHETERLQREAACAARVGATAAKLDRLVSLNAAMDRESATLGVQRRRVAVHPLAETGDQMTLPSSPHSSNGKRHGLHDPVPMAVGDIQGA